MPQAAPSGKRLADDPLNQRRLALIFLSAVLAAITLTVFLAAAGRPEAIALYAAFGPFCHQQIERTWMLASHPLPVCVRCFGFYAGALAATALGLRFSMRLLCISVGFALVTFIAEIAAFWTAPGALRWLSGVLLGWSLVSPLAGTAQRRSEVLRKA